MAASLILASPFILWIGAVTVAHARRHLARRRNLRKLARVLDKRFS
jgi:hypothetical protein